MLSPFHIKSVPYPYFFSNCTKRRHKHAIFMEPWVIGGWGGLDYEQCY